MTNETSTQAKLLARYLREKGFAQLTHTQALEAIAHASNLKSYAVLAAQAQTAPETVKPTTVNTHDQATALLRQAIALGLNVGDALSVYAESRTPVELLYLQTAKEELSAEGDLEFDDNAIVSPGDDPGAYVMSWSWVADSDIPLPKNPALRFLMKFDSISVEMGDTDYDGVTVDQLDLNIEALESLAKDGLVEDTTWLVRTRPSVANAFELTKVHFNALKPNRDDEYYKGTVDGNSLVVQFHQD